ncbi:MAG: hypothetical protein AAGD40_07615 [Pseudomonadota bacterium]
MTDSYEEPSNTESAEVITTVSRYVIIEDIDISFWSMVWLLVKFAFAVIPAAIVIAGIWLVITMIFGGLMGL